MVTNNIDVYHKEFTFLLLITNIQCMTENEPVLVQFERDIKGLNNNIRAQVQTTKWSRQPVQLCLTWATPSSQPRITSPRPMRNLKGFPRSREESNFEPSLRVPGRGEKHQIYSGTASLGLYFLLPGTRSLSRRKYQAKSNVLSLSY